MSADGATTDAVTADLALAAGGCQLRARITITTQPIRVRQMLPLVQSLADQMVDSAAEAVRKQGQQVSCKKGCAACCRQLVPLAPAEARAIRDLVENSPEPRRTALRARFAETRRCLEQAGLLEPLLQGAEGALSGKALQDFGCEYVKHFIACPFLEDETCSIYADRPVACREHLVTSPPEHCVRPSPETVRHVPIPFRLWPTMARLDSQGSAQPPWVALPLALEWAENHPEEAQPRPGPELVREFVQCLTGKNVPPPRQARTPG